jgi:glycerate kinase
VKVLIAPDKFKGSLSAADAAEAIRLGVQRAWPDATLSTHPMSDGGEGFLDAVRAGDATARDHHVVVRGALGEHRRSVFVTVGDTAYIESADVVGLHRLRPTPRTALSAGTYGVGQLVRAALDTGCTSIVVGLGGSSTTDGGVGMLVALGARVSDERGAPLAAGGGSLASLAGLDLSGLDERLARCSLVAATDVTNPLLGPDGAAQVYARQKGADDAGVVQLSLGLERWRDVVHSQTGRELDVPGGGAAGGLGAALAGVLGATVLSGAELVLDLTGLRSRIAQHDWVITGEGSLDSQSLQGKGPVTLVRVARSQGVPAAVVAGRCLLEEPELAVLGVRQTAVLADHFDDPMTDAFDKLVDVSSTLALRLYDRRPAAR